MPTPITITRIPSELELPTKTTMSLTPSSQKDSTLLSASYGKEVADLMDYSIARFGTSTESDITVAPSSSFSRLETTFCRNFTCCGQALDDLHDLLQHYEECHVRFEDDGMDEDDVPSMSSGDDDVSSSDSSSSTSSQPPSPRMSERSTADNLKRKASNSVDAYGDNNSAFDTAVMRSPIAAGANKKRSIGYYPGGPSSTNNSSNPNTAVHQSLRRALIDGGIGRSARGQIYAANSPFSTPGSSLPGTPRGEDVDFFPGGGSSAASSGSCAASSSTANAFSAMSIRNNEDMQMPSCAPPNLFFPSSASASHSSSSSANKKDRLNSGATAASIISASSAPVEKPFKCPEIGCDKAYKQMNGLKYHRLHGQCNQNKLPVSSRSGSLVSHHVPSAAPSTPMSATTAAAVNEVERLRLNTNLAAAAAAVAASSAASTASPAATSPSSEYNTPTSSAPGSPRSSTCDLSGVASPEKLYVCQVGECGKRYRNLNGLRYHYNHSGSHGALGLALLQNHGGGNSAKVDSSGLPAVSTATLTSEELAAAAHSAALAQAQQSAPTTPTTEVVHHPSLPLGPSPSLN